MKNISLEINGVLFDKLTVAENHQDMTEGLENRTQMDADEGMIYVFDSDSDIAFVNENRWLDIDMIMVDGQGKITAVHTMKKAVFKDDETEEEHLASRPYYPSSAPYQYVFELKSGMAKKSMQKSASVWMLIMLNCTRSAMLTTSAMHFN